MKRCYKAALFIMVILAVMAGYTVSLGVQACEILQRPCNISVKDVELEDLIHSMFNHTGVVIWRACSFHERRALCTPFTYRSIQGREIRTMDCVPSTSAIITYSTYGDRKICEALDDLLHVRGYCWWTLGCGLYIDKAVTIKYVISGQGYIHNQFRDQTTIFIPRGR